MRDKKPRLHCLCVQYARCMQEPKLAFALILSRRYNRVLGPPKVFAEYFGRASPAFEQRAPGLMQLTDNFEQPT